MSGTERCLWTMATGIGDTRPVTLDGVEAIELAELLAFTADALGWRGADVIRADLAAHLRRWATELHPVAARPDGTSRRPADPFVGPADSALIGGLADSS